MLLYLKYLKWAQNLLRRNIVVPKSSVPCFLGCHIILALGRLKILPTLFLIGKMFLKWSTPFRFIFSLFNTVDIKQMLYLKI